jgi:DNA modification methylase
MTASAMDPNNKLNDLNGKEWIQFTRSWRFQRGLGRGHRHARFEALHPAPFSFQDVMKFILQFTKEGMTVLDPFCGVASTQKAAALTARNAIGYEIVRKWARLGKRRLKAEVPHRSRKGVQLRVINRDCLMGMRRLSSQSVDFVITSPPYWGILNKDPDKKILQERVTRGLATRYSGNPADLGNVKSYTKFLGQLTKVLRGCKRVLKRSRYAVFIVGDFRHGPKYFPFHSDLVKCGEKAGFVLKGIMVLIQSNKHLYPYGYPNNFVQNIHHQYALIFQRS